MGLLEQRLVEFIQGCSFEELPSNVVEVAKTGVLDWLGVTIAGAKHPSVQTLLDKVVQSQGGAGSSTVIGHSKKLQPFWAALVNGVSTHVLDFDDAYTPGTMHPGGPVLNALLVAAEGRQVNGKDFLTAYVTGVEISTRLGKAISPDHYLAGWHATATLGSIGAAAAVGKLLNLSAEELHAALGFAATQASGLREAFGSLAKPFHVGKAAMNGLLSVQLAQAGMKAGDHMLSGKNGFLWAMAKKRPDPQEVIGERQDYQILWTFFKKYACCFETHASVEAAVRLHKRILNNQAADILEVVLRVPLLSKEIANIEQPRTGLEGKFCLAFCAAVGLVRGRAGLSDFTDETLAETQIRGIYYRTQVNCDPGMSGGAVLTVKTSNGSFEEQVKEPSGSPPNILSFGEVREKFRDCCAGALPASVIPQISGYVEQIDQVKNMQMVFDNLC